MELPCGQLKYTSFTPASLSQSANTAIGLFPGRRHRNAIRRRRKNLTALNAAQLTTGTLPPARLGLSQITASLGANVSMNNTANYFDGPSVAQGSTGTWWASGAVTATDTAGAANIDCKLWDGTTIIDSRRASAGAVNINVAISLSGFIASPAGNIRISCRNIASTSGVMFFNATGNSKDSAVSAFRIN